MTRESKSSTQPQSRVLSNKGKKYPPELGNRPCQKVVLRPAGYPLRLSEDEILPQLTSDDPRLFEDYAKSQWLNLVISHGDFIFDNMMFPDFAFQVINIYPNPSRLGERTRIYLQFSAKQEISLKIAEKRPSVTFDDIVGQNEAREKCKVIQWFLSKPENYTSPWMPRNILFYGPPGTGKTMMARALANSVTAKLFIIKANDLIGVFVGEGSKKIRQLYEEARKSTPAIIFLDEIDSIALKRGYQSIRGDVMEIVSSLLGEMDGVIDNPGVVTIASTNLADEIDDAVASRFEQLIEFKLPDDEERFTILSHNMKKCPIPCQVDLRLLASLTKGWSGRDIVNRLIKIAIHNSILRKATQINTDDFLKIIQANDRKMPNRLYS